MINDLKKKIVKAAVNAGEGHIASAFSILDIMWVLHETLESNDVFILSKGHASLALYVLSAPELLSTFSQFRSKLGGHPDRLKAPGAVASTGSLGHGFPIAVGIALARKITGKPGRVYCLAGDGEFNEGSMWEACLLAAHHQLDNLCLIVDYNHSGDRAIKYGSYGRFELDAKLINFGFRTRYVKGHDYDAIQKALNSVVDGFPHAIVAETIKGKGVKRMENNPAWHHRIPTQDEAKEILEELS